MYCVLLISFFKKIKKNIQVLEVIPEINEDVVIKIVEASVDTTEANNVSVDTPHYEPLVAAIDFGGNNFDDNTASIGNREKLKDVSKGHLYGDKITASSVLNKNRRRKIPKNNRIRIRPENSHTFSLY